MAVVTTVLIAQSTQAAGQIITPTFVAPQLIPVPYFSVFAVMNAADIADNSLNIGLAFQIRNPALVFETVVACQWWGNAQHDKLGNIGLVPRIGWTATSVLGTVCRAVLTLPKSLSIGLTGQITT